MAHTAKNDDGMATAVAVEVWHALRDHGPCSATRLHALRGASGRAAATSDRLVELLHAKPQPFVEIVGLDRTGRGLHARVYQVTIEPKARPPKGSQLEARVLELVAAAGSLDFTTIKRATRAHRDTLAAACKRLVTAQRLSKSSGSRPTYTLRSEPATTKPAKRDRSAVRLSERHGMIDGPCGRRLTVREEYEDA